MKAQSLPHLVIAKLNFTPGKPTLNGHIYSKALLNTILKRAVKKKVGLFANKDGRCSRGILPRFTDKDRVGVLDAFFIKGSVLYCVFAACDLKDMRSKYKALNEGRSYITFTGIGKTDEYNVRVKEMVLHGFYPTNQNVK